MSTPERAVHPVHIEDEIKKSYLDYAMSVIIGRALPDVRDGLKPVHRRVLFAQEQQGNRWNAAYKKAARIVGDVIGKYHPHGDLAVYDAIVRLAQDFSMRYPLIDGQGNFGSVDGDPPAAMRYTEVRMSRLASELLTDIDKETVDFIPNYDGQEEEPVVLPAKFPNLLINGSSGIAVGMATNIPPHNLVEIVTATIALIENPAIELLELMQIVPGPDFPTGGIIQGHAGIRQAYETGRGIIQVRARTEIETDPKRNRDSIVVSELPFQVNKARLIEKIADLVKNKIIEGISDVRDESDREGMRMVVELKRDGDPNVVLNQLYKHTPLHSSFGIIFLAIVAQQPRILGLKDLLREFVEHRREVVTRRTRYELRKAEERAHILEGLKIALDHLDEVIALIRASQSPDEAKASLIGRFQFSEIQAQAILDMRLQRLTSLEREKIIQEYEETLRLIARLKEILANDRLLMSLIVDELKVVREAYGDERRTEIAAYADEVLPEDLIPQEDVVVTVSHAGYIKRTSLASYRAQRRGGKGRIGMTMKDEDFVEHLFVANTHSYIMPFTQGGRSYWLRVHRIPHVDSAGRGRSIVNLLELGNDEKVASLLSLKDFEPGRFVFMTTDKGVVKKTPLELFGNVRAQGIIAADVREGDRLFAVRLTDGQSEILIGTAKGLSIRFEEADVRPMGRTACGVTGVRLRGDDRVVGVAVHAPGETILTVTERGYGKRTPIDEYRLQTRGGKGVINIKTTARNGLVACVLSVAESDEVMVISEQGKILRIGVGDISIIGRATQGVRIMDLDEGDRVVAVAKVVESAGGVEAAVEGDEVAPA